MPGPNPVIVDTRGDRMSGVIQAVPGKLMVSSWQDPVGYCPNCSSGCIINPELGSGVPRESEADEGVIPEGVGCSPEKHDFTS